MTDKVLQFVKEETVCTDRDDDDGEVCETVTKIWKLMKKSFFVPGYSLDKAERIELASQTGLDVKQIEKLYRSLHKNASLSKQKAFPSERQTRMLVQEFTINWYPSVNTRQHLANQMKVPLCKIDDWFNEMRCSKNIDKKKYNRSFTDGETAVLKEMFNQKMRPNLTERMKVAAQLDVPVLKINSWLAAETLKLKILAKFGIGNGIRRKVKPRNPSAPVQFTEEELDILIQAYADSKFPSRKVVVKLAEKLKVSFSKVYAWFQYQKNCERGVVPSGKPKRQTGQPFVLTQPQKGALNQEIEVRRRYNLTKVDRTKRNAILAKHIGVTSKFIVSWLSRNTIDKYGHRDANEQPRFTKEQKVALLKLFQLQRYPSTAQKKILASQIGLSLAQIRWWFLRKRLKRRREIAARA